MGDCLGQEMVGNDGKGGMVTTQGWSPLVTTGHRGRCDDWDFWSETHRPGRGHRDIRGKDLSGGK